MKIVLTIVLLLSCAAAISSTIEVGKGKKFSTIKSALAVANDGDVVTVSNGTYAEGEIIIDRAISFKGISWPVIEGNNKCQLLRIQANGVTVEGLEFRNSGYSSSYDWAA